MDPRQFNEVAAALAQGRTPGHWRSATSRAYYAVFNVGVEVLRDIVPLGKGAKAHGQVQKVLGACSDGEVKQVGSDLGDLHSRRIDADYELSNKDAENPATVRATVAEAQEMIRILDRAFPSNTSHAVKKSIQQYWTEVLREPLGRCKPA